MIQNLVDGDMTKWEEKLRKLLPTLPVVFDVTIEPEFLGEPVIKQTDDMWYNAVGGSTPTQDTIKITIDDRIRLTDEELLVQLKETYFHEVYHLARGYSFESKNLTLLDVAVEEGLATKFEMETTGSDPWYAMHKDRKTMLKVLAEVLQADKLPGPKDWQKWKFYDKETDRYWILYRLGAFLIEDVIRSKNVNTVNLVRKTCKEILAMTSRDVQALL